MKSLLIIFLLLISIQLNSLAQAWHLSATKLETFAAISGVNGVQVDISVQDNDGIAVRGLKAVNFVGFAKTCDAQGRSCIYTPAPVLRTGGSTDFNELAPGVYEMTFTSLAHSSIDALLVQVLSKITIQVTGSSVNSNQKAQILISH